MTSLIIDENMKAKLDKFLELLLKWNAVYNLVATNERETILDEHINDSLVGAPYLQGKIFLDLGSGGGFPGVPLAIVCPEKEFVLLDSRSKKTRFLEQVRCEVELPNVKVVQSRVEDYLPGFCFDGVVSRACASLGQLWEWSNPLLGQYGVVYAWKAKHWREEMDALPCAAQVIELPHALGKERVLVQLSASHLQP